MVAPVMTRWLVSSVVISQRDEDRHQRDAAGQHPRIAHAELEDEGRQDEARHREDSDDDDEADGVDHEGGLKE